jgi:hypothetical protein
MATICCSHGFSVCQSGLGRNLSKVSGEGASGRTIWLVFVLTLFLFRSNFHVSTVAANDLGEETDIIEEQLHALPPNIQSIIETEREANRLQLNIELRIAVILVPYFQPKNFQYFRAWRESNFQSSTFRLADLLEMLPGQVNHERAIFQVRELRELRDHEYPYKARCLKLGLATFICRHFHSLEAQEGRVDIRTTIGMFKIFSHGTGVVISFLPRNRAPTTHQLAAGDFQSIQRFAQGQVRLSPLSFELAYHREAAENELWIKAAIDLVILTPGLDHPQCIRFTTQRELEILETSREICKAVIRIFIRLVEDKSLEGIEAFEQWEVVMPVFQQSRDADFVHPDSPKVISEACQGIFVIVCPDEKVRSRLLSHIVDDFRETLNTLRAGPAVTSTRIKEYLKGFFE